MSEKRFTLVGGKNKFNEILVKVYDNFEEEVIEKQKVVELLNEQQATIESKEKTITIQKKGLEEYSNQIVDLSKKVKEQQATINRLQRKCFELEKDYLIETSDISDKIYLEDEIKKLKKEYGVIDDE